MAANKVKVWKVEDGEYTRLMKGTLRQVSNKLLSEYTVEPCSAEDAHLHSAVKIEDVTSEP